MVALKLLAIYIIVGSIIGLHTKDQNYGTNGRINMALLWPVVLIVYLVLRYKHWRSK